MSIGREREPASDEHRDVRALLPWYANATLGADEAARVERHLATCEACRDDLARCRGLSAVVASEAGPSWSPSPRHFSQVLALIDRVESARAGHAESNRAPRTLVERLREWLADTPRPMRWALAAQAALVVVLAAGLVLVMPVQQATYETLSRPGAAAASGRAQLRIVFADDLTASELGALLQGVDGQIVRGPSPTGVYTIELPFTPAARERLGQVLVTLRSDPKVRLAEPVGPAPVQ